MKQLKARKAGRPPLPKVDAKAKFLRVRVTPDELHAIKAESKKCSKSASVWIRDVLKANVRIGGK